MKELSVNEMHEVKGGSKAVVGLAIVAGITFLIGVIDGQARLKWQNRKNTELAGNLRGKPLIQIRRKG